MSKSLNKVLLIGNVGANPALRRSSGGSPVCNLDLATTETWRDKDSGEPQAHTEWHRLVFFGGLAELVCERLRKGSQIFVEGRLKTHRWQDKDGRDRTSTEVIVDDLNMLGGRPSSDSDAL